LKDEGERPPHWSGEHWESLSLKHKAILSGTLDTLDRVWTVAGMTRPAWSLCCDWLFFNWADQKFVRCGYSSPSLNAGRDQLREALGASVDGVVHFAGEATNTYMDVTVTGAMDTGVLAAEAVIGNM